MNQKTADVIYPAHYMLFDYAIKHNLFYYITEVWDTAMKYNTVFTVGRVRAYREWLEKEKENKERCMRW